MFSLTGKFALVMSAEDCKTINLRSAEDVSGWGG
jgi:hypothetical protein